MLVEVFLIVEGSAVDAGELRPGRVAAPVGPGDGEELHRPDRARVLQMRPPAQVREVTLRVQGQGTLGRVDQLDLVRLTLLLEDPARDVTFDLAALEGPSLHDLAPDLILELRQIILGDGARELEVVVEPVLDRRADRDARAGEDPARGLGDQVGGRVAQHRERVGILPVARREDLDARPVLERQAQVLRRAVVEPHKDGLIGEPRPDRPRGIQRGRAFRQLERGSIRQVDGHAKSILTPPRSPLRSASPDAPRRAVRKVITGDRRRSPTASRRGAASSGRVWPSASAARIPPVAAPVRQTVERELKLGATAAFRLPELPGDPIEARVLVATYFDTADHRLAEGGVTLRRRVEPEGTFWQLKLPRGISRIELEVESTSRTPPGQILGLLVARLRGSSVEPVATLRTRRSGVRVRGIEGPIADVTVDLVSVLEGRRVVRRFSEIEAELLDGDEEALSRIGRALVAAGAVPGDSRPTSFQALDIAAPETPQPPTVRDRESTWAS